MVPVSITSTQLQMIQMTTTLNSGKIGTLSKRNSDVVDSELISQCLPSNNIDISLLTSVSQRLVASMKEIVKSNGIRKTANGLMPQPGSTMKDV